MAFPFLNGLAFWSAVPAGAVMIAGFFLAGGHAAAGWTSYPPLSGLPENSGIGVAAGNFVQIAHSTWPMVPICTLLFAQFMFAAYICAYFVKLGSTALNVAVSVLLSAIFAVLITRGIQHISYDGQSCWFFSLFWLGFSSLMGAVNYLTTIVKLRARA